MSELSSDGAGKLASQEKGSLFGTLVEATSHSVSFLSVKSSKVTSDVFPDSLDLSQLAGTTRCGLSIS